MKATCEDWAIECTIHRFILYIEETNREYQESKRLFFRSHGHGRRRGVRKIGKWAWTPLVFIILANLAFGVLLGGLPSIGLPPMGMIAAIYALTFISSMAEAGWKFKNTFILATVLAIGSYVAFVLVLKLQFAVWPTFITG